MIITIRSLLGIVIGVLVIIVVVVVVVVIIISSSSIKIIVKDYSSICQCFIEFH